MPLGDRFAVVSFVTIPQFFPRGWSSITIASSYYYFASIGGWWSTNFFLDNLLHNSFLQRFGRGTDDIIMLRRHRDDSVDTLFKITTISI